MKVRIGTRGSALARWQADHIAGRLRALRPDLEIEERVIVTEGDRFQAGPVLDRGGKGVWVKEIEEELLAGTIDLAVHSLKDVPAALPAGLELGAFPERADPRDALVTRTGGGFASLPAGARLGTSSLRRVCQVRALRPDLQVEMLRGNVDTRLRKVAEGFVDAAVLACAGLDRLGLAARIAERVPETEMLPAIGQGALAIEIRTDAPETRALVAGLDHRPTAIAVAAERGLLEGLGVGCRTPVAGHARVAADGSVRLDAMVGRPDASEILREDGVAPAGDAAALGREVARRLLGRGADRILRELEGRPGVDR